MTCTVLTLTWQESGGPKVSEPERSGFGSRLIRSGISSKKGTSVDLRFEPEGVVCVLEARLGKTEARPL